ncbi:hypothetical protein HYDPIDRAFT_116779 [Hydnomerulius pinastri MD-312]|uniref:C2H2-type domain-containing protein n=1 Tax=Hydnomerulius pinastri MD-312 TaxID=994086 RepID=A0A0C9WAW3_9AGAM|nr:hypothetical protein HYDPIDRAFT_116779 [Hydnomerulius pinastri MD-312]
MKRKRAAPQHRRRPRTRQYVRVAEEPPIKEEGSGSEYLGSDSDDAEESADDELYREIDSSAPPSTKRRRADIRQKSTRRIRCEEPFCSRSFTRPADLRRHIATIHKDLSLREVLKETREEYRL